MGYSTHTAQGPRIKRRSSLKWLAAAAAAAAVVSTAFAVDTIVTGKKISDLAVTSLQNVGSLPMNMITTADGAYALVTDMGFRQSIWSIRTSDGVGVSHVDFPNFSPSDNGLYYGLAIKSDGTLYAAQGGNDSIAVLRVGSKGQLVPIRTIATAKGDFPSGLALDGRGYLYVANNDAGNPGIPGSLAIYNTLNNRDMGGKSVEAEVGRFKFTSSFNGTPNFPLAVAAMGDGHKVYASSQRDGAVYVLDATDATSPKMLGSIDTGAGKFTAASGARPADVVPTPTGEMPVGSHPVDLLLTRDQSRLYVANATSDTVSVVSTKDDSVMATISLQPSTATGLPGVSPTHLALSPDEKSLFVSLGDLNAVAVVGTDDLTLKAYVPAGWYPSAVVAPSTPNGRTQLLVANAKGMQARYPNPGYVQWEFNNNPEYDLNLIEGNVAGFRIPSDPTQLEPYTDFVLALNGVATPVTQQPNPLSAIGLKAGNIKHVVYIIKENRTYDQVLGDMTQGNGDPSLVLFGQNVTPNLHALASRFVLLDNFYDISEASGDGWPWSTQALANEYVIKDLPYNYSGRGRNYDFEGQNNGYPAGGFPAKDPDGNPLSAEFPSGLPPIPDVAESPGGHIWDAVKNAGLSMRNYGFFYNFGVTQALPDGNRVVSIPDNYPASGGLQPGGHDLAGTSDLDYRRYDNGYADSDAPQNCFDQTKDANCLYPTTQYGKYQTPSRFSEWNREFQEMLAKDPTGNAVPSFMMVRFHHDHTSGVSYGVHTPRSMVADNDYACGQLVEALSKSPIWKNTAVFIIEDDSQDGPDHVDSHRSICFVASPWIKAGAVDHTFYNTASVLKTMELLLGVPPMTHYDAIANPIMDWDTIASNAAPYAAILPDQKIIAEVTPKPTATTPLEAAPLAELVARTAKLNLDLPDSAPARELNEIIWKSVKGLRSTMPEPRHSRFIPLHGPDAHGGTRSTRDTDD